MNTPGILPKNAKRSTKETHLPSALNSLGGLWLTRTSERLFPHGAFLRRAHIRLDVLMPVAVLTVLGVVVWLALAGRSPRPTVSGDALDIRLVGVRPDCSDDLLDAQGRQIGEQFYDGDRDAPWGSNRLRRDFILEVAGTNELAFPPQYDLRTSDNVRLAGYDQAQVTVLPDGRQQVLLATAVPTSVRKYFLMWLWPRQVAVSHVDVHLHYFLKESGQTLAVFNGPFMPQERRVLPEGYILQMLTNKVEHRVISAQFQVISSTQYLKFPQPLIATDTNGLRRLAWVYRTYSGPHRWDGTAQVINVPLEALASIHIELPREKVFHHVRVRYPGRPARAYPEFYDRMAARLPAPPAAGQMNNYPFKNPLEAIQVVDLVRGAGPVRRIVDAIRNSRPRLYLESLDAPTRDQLRQAANAWAQAANPAVRLSGVTLGLEGDWPEFISPALDLVERDERHDSEAVYALQSAAGQLSENDIQRIQRLLMHPFPRTPVDRLIRCLQSATHAAADGALRQLAQADQPWIWWHAVMALANRRSETAGPFPTNLLPRLALIQGQNPVACRGRGVPVAEDAVRALIGQVPALLTTELRRRDAEVFYILYQRLLQHCDRAAARALMVDHLRHFRRPAEDAYDDSWISIKMVQQFNQWHGTDFGPYGRDPKKDLEIPPPVEELQRVIAEVLVWRDP